MIRIVAAHYTNFRALRDVRIPFGKTTVLVGPNNAGKTSILEGLERALGLGRRAYAFDEGDVSEGADPLDGFSIRVEFAPAGAATFTADEIGLFGNHVDVVDGEHRLFVVIVGRPDEDEGVFRTRLRFSKSDGAVRSAVRLPLLQSLPRFRAQLHDGRLRRLLLEHLVIDARDWVLGYSLKSLPPWHANSCSGCASNAPATSLWQFAEAGSCNLTVNVDMDEGTLTHIRSTLHTTLLHEFSTRPNVGVHVVTSKRLAATATVFMMSGALLGGCLGVTAPSASTLSLASPTPVPTPPTPDGSRNPAACLTADLRVELLAPGFGAGNVGAWLRLTNSSAASCELQGWPTLVGVTADGVATIARQTKTVMTFPSLVSAPLVTLEPNGVAFAAFEGSDNPPAADASCPPDFVALQFAAPGDAQTVSISAWNNWLGSFQPACAGLSVTMIVAPSAVPDDQLALLEATPGTS